MQDTHLSEMFASRGLFFQLRQPINLRQPSVLFSEHDGGRLPATVVSFGIGDDVYSLACWELKVGKYPRTALKSRFISFCIMLV